MTPVAYPAKPAPVTKARGKRAQQHEESSSKRPKLMSSVVNDINQSTRHPALFIGADGHITPHAPDHASQPCCFLSLKTFRHVAKRIDQIMKESIDKNKAIIHCDGPTPSRQKSGERFRRQEYLVKKLQELSLQVDKISINKRSLTAVYNKCKSLYRAPETAISEILDELSNLDWKVCRCQYQADSHIAELCRDDPDAVIVTKDSDFIVYENTESVIMPVGRGRELTRFDKADVMTALNLPSARHLLLASILSKNDYSSPIPWFGIHKNAEVVRELEIDQYSSNFQLVGIMKEAIRKYLVQIGKLDSKTPHDYRHAITAFVECREDTSDDAVPSRSTHDSIVELLRKIEQAKIARRRPASSVSDPATLSNIASLSDPSSSLEPASLLDLTSLSDQASLPDSASSLDLASLLDPASLTDSASSSELASLLDFASSLEPFSASSNSGSSSEPTSLLHLASSSDPASFLDPGSSLGLVLASSDPASSSEPAPSHSESTNNEPGCDVQTPTGRTQRKRRKRRGNRRSQKILASDPVSPSEPVPSSSTGRASSSEPAPTHSESIDNEPGNDGQTPADRTQRKRRRRRGKRGSQKTLASDPVSPSEPVPSSSTGRASLSDPTPLTDPGTSRPDHNNEQGNKDGGGRAATGRTQRKRRKRRRRRRKTQKIADWKQSSYKSKNADDSPRYTPYTIKDVSNASPVEDSALGEMTVSVPKPKKKVTIEAVPEPEATTLSDNRISEYCDEGECSTSANNSKGKDLKGKQGTNKGKDPEKGKAGKGKEGKGKGVARKRCDAKDLKDDFSKIFKTATMTAGSLSGCIRRATSLDDQQVRSITKCVDNAVHALSQARIIAYWAIEHYLYREVTASTTPESTVSTVVEMVKPTEPIGLPEPTDPLEPTDPPESTGPPTCAVPPAKAGPLDLLLDSSHGTTIIRNLLSIALGDSGHHDTEDPQAQEAQRIGKDMYHHLKSVLPDLQHVNPDAIPLGIAVMDLAKEMHTSILTHFRRLPGVIVGKMKKLGRNPDDIPDPGTAEDDNDSDEEQLKKYRFEHGHILAWWAHFKNLPEEVRPVFTPTSGFRDTFMLLSESALIRILWGDGRKKYYPTRSIMETICSRKEAEDLAQSHYGEFLHKLFIGDRDKIRLDPRKRQTSYGRQTVTMECVHSEAPSVYSHDALKAYRESLSSYFKARKEAKEQGIPCTATPPAFPYDEDAKRRSGRYAISNYLRTDGLQAHILAFDITKPWPWSKARIDLPKIERRFPDLQSIIDAFGPKYKDCAVIGVDPGEVITAAFCGLNPHKPDEVTNLLVRRSAQYSPTVAHRRAIDHMKRRRPLIETQDPVGPDVWTKQRPQTIQGTQDNQSNQRNMGTQETQAAIDPQDIPEIQRFVEIPSIKELENSLHSSKFVSMDSYHDGLKQLHYVFDALSGFYGSHSMKKRTWEHKKSLRAEKDWAVDGALEVVKRSSANTESPPLIVYGNGTFNSHTKLSSLHESFKGYFFMKSVRKYLNGQPVRYTCRTLDGNTVFWAVQFEFVDSSQPDRASTSIA
ncbi:MAG: hypothetical protein J3Q66DRAFT_365588 [Benniella sp.]|nr:MAG: hypothetical protein J3Q66DRAFT_365588 [Benniella sp.]